MAKVLGRKKPHEDNQCLHCHVRPHFEKVAVRAPASFVQDGVSCEVCHGPAEKWVAEHHQDFWKGFSSGQKEQRGMQDTKSLPGRIKLCLDCHVGSPEANVDHELIAAGHPRLNFEFAAFHASWARHWPDARDKDSGQGGYPDFEARAWAFGQIKTAQAALALLEGRSSGNRKPWLEFAELDCFACHRELKARDRQQNPNKSQHAGSVPWSLWYGAQLPTAVSLFEPTEGARLGILLKEISAHMAARRNEQGIANLAREAQGRLERLSLDGKDLPIQNMYESIRAEENKKSTAGWEEAAQAYLALAAIHNTWTDQSKLAAAAKLRPLLIDLRKTLRFPEGYNSPR